MLDDGWRGDFACVVDDDGGGGDDYDFDVVVVVVADLYEHFDYFDSFEDECLHCGVDCWRVDDLVERL